MTVAFGEPHEHHARIDSTNARAKELALDGAGNAWRAGLPNLAESNLSAAENQMSGLQPLLPMNAGGE